MLVLMPLSTQMGYIYNCIGYNLLECFFQTTSKILGFWHQKKVTIALDT